MSGQGALVSTERATRLGTGRLGLAALALVTALACQGGCPSAPELARQETPPGSQPSLAQPPQAHPGGLRSPDPGESPGRKAPRPDAFALAEARCRWPCDAPGCIKPLTGTRCLLACSADTDCPPDSICICETDRCSLGIHNLRQAFPETRSGSCFKLLPHMDEMLEECRSVPDAGCSKHPS